MKTFADQIRENARADKKELDHREKMRKLRIKTDKAREELEESKRQLRLAKARNRKIL